MSDLPPSPPHDVDLRRPRVILTLQLLRLPAALGLLALVAQPRSELMIVRMGLYARGRSFAAVWAHVTVAALAFALVVFAARRRSAPLPLLAVEAVIAGAVAFVPPYLWAGWLNHHPVSRVLDFEFAAPLAIGWFAAAVLTMVQQRRGRPTMEGGSEQDASAHAGGGERGDVSAPLLLWLRVPALLALLGVVGASREELVRAWSGAANFGLVWAQIVLPALAFTLVALVRRRDRTPWPALAVEIVLAAALAFAPPHQWFGWLNWDELALVLSFEFIAPLAMSWFAIAGLTAVRQRADQRPHAP